MKNQNQWPLPSPNELVRACRTVQRLQRAMYSEVQNDPSVEPLWDRLVGAHLAMIGTTRYLGATDPAYAAAWERMLEDH